MPPKKKAPITTPTAGRKPGHFLPESLPTRLAEMPIGECYTQSKRLSLDGLSRDQISTDAEKMASSLRAAARRASARDGAEYIVETGNFIARNNSVVVCAVVTRTK